MKVNKLYLYTDVSGNRIYSRYYEYGQGVKKIYIQGGVHGGEVTYYIFHELSKWLKKNELKLNGIITLAPIINPVAWNQRIYYYTVGKFDLYKGTDWNRSYPGNDTTMSAKNSSKLFNYFKNYEIAIDLHTARTSKPYSIFTDSSIKEIIKTLGLKYNLYFNPNLNNNSKLSGAMSFAASESGMKSFTLESGSHDDYNPENIETVVSALKNLVLAQNLLPEMQKEKEIKQIQYAVDEIDVLYSPISGFIKYLVNPHDNFKRNDVLAIVLDSSKLGKKTLIKAPYDGVAFETARTNIIWTGDELFRIIAEKNLKKL